jgi:hypothetical protein
VQLEEMLQDDPRLDPRSNVFLTAVLCSAESRAGVRIRNLSVHGALLEGGELPLGGAIVEIRRGSLSAAGEIAWSHDGYCGVRFLSTIDVSKWIQRAGPIGQQRIDAAIANFHRQPPRPASFAILPSDLKPSSDLTTLANEILQICDRMASGPTLSIPVAEQILKIEAAAQAIGAADKAHS